MELTGTEPPQELLEKLNFNSVEGMEIQLDNWKLREGLLDRESESRPAKKELPKTLPQRLRDAGPGKTFRPLLMQRTFSRNGWTRCAKASNYLNT
jgi:hypothetical protein